MTSVFNYISFYKNVKKDFLQIEKAKSSVEKGLWDRMYDCLKKESEFYDVHNSNQENLTFWLKTAEVKIFFACEYLQLLDLKKDLKSELDLYIDKYHELQFNADFDFFYSDVFDILKKYLSAIVSQIEINDEMDYSSEYSKQQNLLNQIIRGTPKLLTDLSIIPHNESIIRNTAYNILTQVFPDTVREESISKVTKVFKPDIGIRSLKTAIEYKFISSKEEAKKAIGGIFEDVGGYEGSEDWKVFYAVLYMTDNFLTQEQVEAEFKIAKIPSYWKIILLFGKGERKKKT